MKDFKKAALKFWKGFKSYVQGIDDIVFISLVMGLVLTITLLIFIPKEIKHSKLLPLGFSEVEQIEYDLDRKGKTIDPITEYYAKLNDVIFKVFECWNTSLEFGVMGNNNEAFARELQSRKDQKRYKYEFDLFETLPKTIDRVMKKLKAHKFDLRPTLRNVEVQFGKAWDEEHDDEYRQETYTTTDEDGNVEIHTHQVYDHTDHTYTYHKKEGEDAYQLGMKMLKSFYNICWPGRLFRPSKTNAEGEYATDKSRRKVLARHKQADLIQIATKWNEGALYNEVKGDILAYNGMYALMKNWEKNKDKAKSVSYETNSSSDAGPVGFQNVKNIRDLANRVLYGINTLVFSLNTTKGQLPILKRKIDEYIAVVLDGKKGNPKFLRREIISMSKEMYKRNFPKGLDLETFRIGLLLLWFFLALTVGFGIGYGLKRLCEEEDSYGYNRYCRRW